MEQYFLLSVIAIILIIIIVDVAVILAQWKKLFFLFIGPIIFFVCFIALP